MLLLTNTSRDHHDDGILPAKASSNATETKAREILALHPPWNIAAALAPFRSLSLRDDRHNHLASLNQLLCAEAPLGTARHVLIHYICNTIGYAAQAVLSLS
jgi:hypothetical protein